MSGAFLSVAFLLYLLVAVAEVLEGERRGSSPAAAVVVGVFFPVHWAVAVLATVHKLVATLLRPTFGLLRLVFVVRWW